MQATAGDKSKKEGQEGSDWERGQYQGQSENQAVFASLQGQASSLENCSLQGGKTDTDVMPSCFQQFSFNLQPFCPCKTLSS